MVGPIGALSASPVPNCGPERDARPRTRSRTATTERGRWATRRPPARGMRFAAFTGVNGSLGDLAGHLDRLARSKFRLARLELRMEIRRLSRAAVVLAVGFVIGSLAVAFLLLALVYALSPEFSPAAAALFVSVMAGTGALLMLNAGMKRFTGITLRRTNARLHGHLRWARALAK